MQFAWMIVCPDNRVRSLPYLHEKDAEFDAEYISGFGCLRLINYEIKPHIDPCPQGYHHVTFCACDENQKVLIAAAPWLCNAMLCSCIATWRVIIVAHVKDKRVACPLTLKLCDNHKVEVNQYNLIEDDDWQIVVDIFLDKGMAPPDRDTIEFYFVPLESCIEG